MDALSTGLILVACTAVAGLIVWSLQRIIIRIDKIGDQLEKLGNRVSVIETKQDSQVQVQRKTAAKVGVRLPPLDEVTP